mmetsp:Transcript_69058/g.192240  ORF Transcript_69058/g.192240 Transcript_69058/m.192240 type:complete len:264 (-) Transcript_69058:652-1443(-)
MLLLSGLVCSCCSVVGIHAINDNLRYNDKNQKRAIRSKCLHVGGRINDPPVFVECACRRFYGLPVPAASAGAQSCDAASVDVLNRVRWSTCDHAECIHNCRDADACVVLRGGRGPLWDVPDSPCMDYGLVQVGRQGEVFRPALWRLVGCEHGGPVHSDHSGHPNRCWVVHASRRDKACKPSVHCFRLPQDGPEPWPTYACIAYKPFLCFPSIVRPRQWFQWQWRWQHGKGVQKHVCRVKVSLRYALLGHHDLHHGQFQRLCGE